LSFRIGGTLLTLFASTLELRLAESDKRRVSRTLFICNIALPNKEVKLSSLKCGELDIDLAEHIAGIRMPVTAIAVI